MLGHPVVVFWLYFWTFHLRFLFQIILHLFMSSYSTWHVLQVLENWKEKVRLTYIQLCRYRKKTDFPTVSYLTHKIITFSLFWRPFCKTRTNNTVYIIAAKAKLSDTHFSLGHAIHELQSVLQFGLGILLYLISNNTFMMDCSTIFDITFGWWTAQLFRYWWDQLYILLPRKSFVCHYNNLWRVRCLNVDG